MLKLMYITVDPQVALAAQSAGVDWIFVDMERIGKADRQGGMDTVQSSHRVEDIRTLRPVVTTSELLVRCNSVHDRCRAYGSTEEEIDAVVDAGADIIMLPFFQTAPQVRRFLRAVDGRAKTMLLVETPEAVENLGQILDMPGIDMIHIGINDLHLGYRRKFMFELLADGTVEAIGQKIRGAGIPWGFGGVARPGTGTLPAEWILGEHCRLGSSMVILSRSFYDQSKPLPKAEMEAFFKKSVAEIRRWEGVWEAATAEALEENRQAVAASVEKILGAMEK